MIRALYCLALLGCAPISNDELPQPSPTPTPTPCPTPTPAPVPKPSAFQAPAFVLKGTPFSVTLCGQPYKYDVPVYVDSYLLGTFAHDRASGCSLLIVPGLNSVGVRTLRAGGHERMIEVFDGAMITR